MKESLNQIAEITASISNFVWPLFLPFLVLSSLFIAYITITRLRSSDPSSEKISFKKMMGPASISLGAKIGTGAIIGVLGSLNKLSNAGQGFIEGIVLWGILGACVLIPLTYSETFISRRLNQSPVDYIKHNISRYAAWIYSLSLVVLYIFGFGGFQFNGIDTVTSIVVSKTTGETLTEMQRYLFVIVPIIIVASGIILTKKHTLFINSLSGMIGLAVISYFAFFFIFLGLTADHIPVFLSRAWAGFTNPLTMAIGAPIGLIFGLQRIIQTSEAGLGTSPLAAAEGKDMSPHNAAMTQVIPTAITVAVSLLITSYITSYGIAHHLIMLPADGISRLSGFFNTAISVTGSFGLVVMSVFAILSGVTTLLGSYFFLTQLFINNRENTNIAIYMALIVIAGTLAVFGFNIIFDVVDILLFAVSGLNVLALTVYLAAVCRTKDSSEPQSLRSSEERTA
mgnify:CR=1 FL=1